MNNITAKRIRKGVKWLDKNVPNWPATVNIKELNLASTCQCVLGQVFAEPASKVERDDEDVVDDYGYRHCPLTGWDFISDRLFEQTDMQLKVERVDDWAIKHGFDYSDDVNSYEELTDAWKSVIACRKREYDARQELEALLAS